MNAIKLLIALSLAGFGYHYWSQHHRGGELAADATSARSQNGFVALPAVDGASTTAVLVVAAETARKKPVGVPTIWPNNSSAMEFLSHACTTSISASRTRTLQLPNGSCPS